MLAAQGKHERAAELYEMAGQLERAASTWADVARTAPKPESFIDRIERLSEAVASPEAALSEPVASSEAPVELLTSSGGAPPAEVEPTREEGGVE